MSVPGGAQAKGPDCADYRHQTHWLPSPVELTTTPTAIMRWQDRLLVLHPSALLMVGTDEQQAPIELGRIQGGFSELAVGSDFIVLGHTGGFQVYDLPALTLRCSHVGGWAGTPRLACTDDLIVAAADGRFYFFGGPADGTVTALSDWAIPHYISLIGAGKLAIVGSNLVRCAGGGNNISGYFTDLSLIDIADPLMPILTDRLTAAPGDSPDDLTIFRDIQPFDGGFVLWWITNRSDIRPEMTSNNAAFLGRIAIEDGHFAWRGYAQRSGPYYGGFAIAGREAIWTMGSGNGHLGESSLIVDLDRDLPAPVVTASLPRLYTGPVGWLPGNALVTSGFHFYHFESAPTAPAKPDDVGSSSSGTIVLDADFLVSWMNTSDWGGDSWGLYVLDRRVSPAAVVATITDDALYGLLTSIAVVNRRVYYSINDQRRTVEIDDSGHFSTPVVSAEPVILDAIPWGPYTVVSTPDSLLICLADDSERLQRVASLGGYSASGLNRLIRVGDVLLGQRIAGSTSNLAHFDLSNPIMPALLRTTYGWGRNIRFQPEAGLLFDCGGERLRWHRVNSDGTITLLGSMAGLRSAIVRDAWLNEGLLYLALDHYGLGVYEFDQDNGPTPLGGMVLTYGAVQIIADNGCFQILPRATTMPLACSDPLPVMISSLRAAWQSDVAVVEWHCSLEGASGDEFVVRRRSGGGAHAISRRPVATGDFRIEDAGVPRGVATSYELWLETPEASPLLLETVPLDGLSGPAPRCSVSAAPNPANPSTLISFETERPSRVRLGIYALDGRLVVTLVDRELESGRHVTRWDGRDADGRSVASGTYLMRLGSEGLVRSGRLTLLR
ncbi:MAG: hypothetical protein IPG61_14170 [bacterium]|nr:hypothetical protein [bacterium]